MLKESNYYIPNFKKYVVYTIIFILFITHYLGFDTKKVTVIYIKTVEYITKPIISRALKQYNKRLDTTSQILKQNK